MSDPTPLGRMTRLLDSARIPYMLAGSFASTFYGPPRSTHDIDLVVDPSSESLDRLLDALDPTRYYVSREAAREALRARSQFNVIDLETGWKVDLIVRKERPFSREEFRRRQIARVAGVSVFVASVEDAILSKLEWAKLGGSERQLRDVEGMLAVHATALDIAYVEHWARVLAVVDLWTRVREQRSAR
jgi:hypothetical protein